VTVLRDRVARFCLLLTALVVLWAAIAVRSWLYALVVAAVGVADLPLVVHVRSRRRMTVALLLHAGVLIVGWFVALLVSAPFTNWE
jgi:hypothetical protein